MAGTDAEHSTTPRPISPISPTGALKLLLDSKLSIHAAAARLTTAMHTNECRLWCNDNLLPPHYIVTSLVVVARTEADGRPRADVVSGVREAWVQQVYNFEFDADEVRALLPPLKSSPESPPAARAIEPTAAPVPPVAPETLEGTERWVFEQMRDDPPRKGDHGYVQKLFNHRPDKRIKKKTIANNVGKYRKRFEIS
jgi:hypothetical protein